MDTTSQSDLQKIGLFLLDTDSRYVALIALALKQPGAHQASPFGELANSPGHRRRSRFALIAL